MMKKVIHSIQSPNQEDRPPGQGVEFLILHYTECDLNLALKLLTDSTSSNPVSAHYVIDEEGHIYQLVDERKTAWHAGKSYWAGRHSLNRHSIGIELVNPGHGPQYRAFSLPQMEALVALSQEILKRHPIPARHVLGHSDIAPQRKIDPGELFDWQFLADHGIGLDPRQLDGKAGASPLDPNQAITLLQSIGYEKPADLTPQALKNLIRAFQLHFYPQKVDGLLCTETHCRIQKLSELINSSL